jgi:hypothetical protein
MSGASGFKYEGRSCASGPYRAGTMQADQRTAHATTESATAMQLSMHSRPSTSAAVNPHNGVHIHIPLTAAKPVIVAHRCRLFVPRPVAAMRAVLDIADAAEKRQQQ